MNASEFSVIKLYRDCLRLVDYISSTKAGASRKALRESVRQAFRKNKDETDPQKIAEQKEAAMRGLSNYMFFEAQRMAKDDAKKGGGSAQG